MKKVLVLIIAYCFLNVNANVYADIDITKYIYSWDSEEAKIPLDSISANCYLFDCNGEKYIYSELSKNSPIKYDEKEVDFFIKNFDAGIYYCHDYIWTGEYYMARLHCSDYISQSWAGHTNFPVRLYDQNYNLIEEYNFNKYVYKINYFDGTYYCYVGNEWMSSKDFQNWDKCDDVTILKTDNISYINNKISINNGKYYDILYENDVIPNSYSIVGDYIFGNQNRSKFVSWDNVYNLKLPIEYSYGFSGIYFNDNYLIYEGNGRYFGATDKTRLYISKKDVDIELNKLKESPYVCYDGKILAFEQPPIIQNDRTLIPIRFLFEQMGAEVTWNGEEQTATISQDNTAITFAIDDTEADVNGQTVSMEIPAQLINDKTMVPVRFLSEALGYTVNWDGETRIITIE